MVAFGQHPAPRRVIAHLSDTHFLADNRPLAGAIDTERNLERTLAQLESSGAEVDAIVFTGDLADLGEEAAYVRLREIVTPVAERMRAPIVWVMGNHDERAEFQRELLDEDGPSAPQDRVYDLDGLRLVALDTSVPGYHHGALESSQLDWLAALLREPADLGTILAMHHPPLPSPIELMAVIELQRQDALAEVVRGTDVRAIFAGHLHYPTFGTFAGIPVSVGAASCYSLDASGRPDILDGVDGRQAYNLTHVYDDGITYSVIPIGAAERISGVDADFHRELAALSPDERLERFSRKSLRAS